MRGANGRFLPISPSEREERFLARFFASLDRSGGEDACWIWRSSVANGYGRIYNGGPSTYVHRVAYTIFVGPIPPGMTIDHLCRNRLCANPRHLEAVTNRENILRGHGASAANARKGRCPSGHLYDEENTRITPRGSRICRACHREYERQRYRERKEAGRPRR